MDGADKTRISVDIYGTQYKLMGNSSVSYMKMIASHVNDHMHHIAETFPRLDTPRIAVLAAVHMADDYNKLKAEFDRIMKDLEQMKADAFRSASLSEENARLMKDRQDWEEERNTLEFSVRSLQLQLQEAVIRGKEQEDLLRKELAEQAAADRKQLESQFAKEQELLTRELNSSWEERLRGMEREFTAKEQGWQQSLEEADKERELESGEMMEQQERLLSELREAKDRQIDKLNQDWKNRFEELQRRSEERLSERESELAHKLESERRNRSDEVHLLQKREQELADEVRRIKEQLLQEKETAAGIVHADESYRLEHETLKEEYEKLKKEYHEWLELVMDKE